MKLSSFILRGQAATEQRPLNLSFTAHRVTTQGPRALFLLCVTADTQLSNALIKILVLVPHTGYPARSISVIFLTIDSIKLFKIN